jgi:hypothetical protein
MAPLRWPEDTNRLDMELMRESPVSLYRSRDVLQEQCSWLSRHGYLIHLLDCSG